MGWQEDRCFNAKELTGEPRLWYEANAYAESYLSEISKMPNITVEKQNGDWHDEWGENSI